MNKTNISKIVSEAVSKTLETNGLKSPNNKIIEESKKPIILKEAVVLTAKTFVLKTDYQSNVTKENHFKIYKNYIDSFNKISAKLDTIDRVIEPSNSDNSEFRRLKLDETKNFNGIKLHELYFDNISDKASNIGMDSVPFLRFGRDWGSFENWQFDFRACGMSATEGWAVLYWEPFKQRYFNCFVEKHTENIPMGGIPILVIDTWHHAWFRDFPESPNGKLNYLTAFMQEINWNVVEMRMQIAERSNLQQIYMVKPMNSQNSNNLSGEIRIANTPPIDKSQVVSGIKV
jgi:Fe-Mn family superoxide dismutase